MTTDPQRLASIKSIEEDLATPTDASLERNARAYRYDPVLDRAADLFDTDPLAWSRLPPHLRDLSGLHHGFREQYRAAVQAGVIPDDRGPGAA